MATYRVPDHAAANAPIGVPPAMPEAEGEEHWIVQQHDGASSTIATQQDTNGNVNPLSAAPSRRNSLTPGAPSTDVANGGNSMNDTNGIDPKSKDLALAGAGAGLAATQTTHSVTKQPVVASGRRARFNEHGKTGWSRGRKICCGLMLFLLAAIITIGVLIAFLVRKPTVSFDRAEVVCANNDYLKCAQDQVQIRVFLTVNNPNILGVTINSELGLFKTDGTFLGPGYIDNTSVGARGTTELIALFTITSNRGYDILVALFIPPTRPVTIEAKGSVFAHVGLLRPSIAVDEKFEIPPQDLGDTIGSLFSGVSSPSSSDVIGAAGDALGNPSTSDVIGAIGGAIGLNAQQAAVAAEADGVAARKGLLAAPPVNAHAFGRALREVTARHEWVTQSTTPILRRVRRGARIALIDPPKDA